ncbi:MAG: SUMF1/EgtB/PvdO family nonheme iron enzyme [Rikenellaceae bacterium]
MKNRLFYALLLGAALVVTPMMAQDAKPASNYPMEKLAEEVKWINLEAISLAMSDMKKLGDYDSAAADAAFAELKSLVDAGFEGLKSEDATAVENAKRAVALKRSILLSNPLLMDAKIVAAKYNVGENARKTSAVGLGTQSNNWSSQPNTKREGFDAAIVELGNLQGCIETREIYKPSNGSSVADLMLHWDGDRVLFSQVEDDSELWNVHEVSLDGTGYHKVIKHDEPDIDFFDATYLPDGNIIANSTTGYNGVPCVSGTSIVSNMVSYNTETENLRIITFDQDSDWNPIVMNNGRVMYTRWEYTDLTHYYSRIVMHMNPDGTENKALYGSGYMFPNSTYDMRPIPNNPSAFIGIISGHHGVVRAGRLILFDAQKGRKGAAGMVQELPYRNREIKEEVKDQLVNGVWPQFIKPSVINENYFLVTAKMSPTSLWGLYLVDRFDNLTCLIEQEDMGFISPQLITKTETPPVIPDRIVPDSQEATFFIQDIYEGEGLEGAPRGIVKELRIYAYEYAYIDTRSDHNWHGIQAGWDLKRELGTVPVEADGSVIFKAPANTPISIQPLDEHGVAVQWMRSWVVGQPGEIVSCVGCHEDHSQIAIPKRVIASQKSATELAAPEGGSHSFTFDLEMQPILDRACIACHDGSGKAFDLRTSAKDDRGHGQSYLNIHPYVRRQGGEGDMAVLNPYEYHANTSDLVRMLKKGHYNVELTDKEWRKLYQWIDFNAPDKGYFNYDQPKRLPVTLNPSSNQYVRRIEIKNKYANGMGVEWKKEIEDYAAYLKSQGEITPEMPKPMQPVKEKVVTAKGWPFSAAEAKAMQTKERMEVEVAPDVKIGFVWIPAGTFVMGSYNGDPDAYPTAKVKVKEGFWMAELETTNEQVRALIPSHDSKYVDQQWKDHVVPGYEANKDEQPATRISYETVMEYCRMVSEKTGLKVTIPTEAQWEWACRAGSEDDFWYGNLNTDFGSKENMADKTTLKFAVVGVNPHPMAETHALYKYYTFLPKEASVDDGSLVMVGGKGYDANPFGLYNMHGDVAEWTRSDYLPYPYKDGNKATSEYKVVRGGSYNDRPKNSSSHMRKYYYPYQTVFNVGFRLIIEE